MRNFVQNTWALTARRLPGVSTDYQLSQGDMLGLEVLEASELNRVFEIQRGGTVSLPLIGEIQAAGKTALELETLIARRLVDLTLVSDPEVLIHVIDYRGKPYYVYGELDLQGQYIMSQRLTLLDAILIAGGLKGPAGDFGYLHRHAITSQTLMASTRDLLLAAPTRPVSAEGSEVLKIDLRPLKSGGLLDENPLLGEGDVFVVPRRTVSEFYVIGEVVMPGRFELPPDGLLYATQALAQAGGPMKTAKAAHGVLIRMDESGTRTDIPVNIDSLMKGETPDFIVENNDVLFVPGSGAKTLAYGALGTLPWRVQQVPQSAISSPQ
jgi:polysaccharide export outer membrane protein